MRPCLLLKLFSNTMSYIVLGSALEAPPQLLYHGLPDGSFPAPGGGGVGHLDGRSGWPYVEAALSGEAVIPCFTSGTPPPITR